MGMGDGLSGRPAAVDTDVHAIHSIRHQMVKGRASPDDPTLAEYWANRRPSVAFHRGVCRSWCVGQELTELADGGDRGFIVAGAGNHVER
jgi:hypothetical protein